MKKDDKTPVIRGMLGITIFYISLTQGLALSGINFGDIPILQGWLGGIMPTFAGGGAALLLRAALRKTNGNVS